jgi:fructose-bisphosphate aldolase class 1
MIPVNKEDFLKKYDHDTVINIKLDNGSIDTKVYNKEKVKMMLDDYVQAVNFDSVVNGDKVFFIDEMRQMINSLLKEEVSMSKFVEDLNVKANIFKNTH